MALPHPQARQDEDGKEDEPSRPGVLGNVFKRAVYISGDRDRQDDVDGAEDCTFGGGGHDPAGVVVSWAEKSTKCALWFSSHPLTEVVQSRKAWN